MRCGDGSTCVGRRSAYTFSEAGTGPYRPESFSSSRTPTGEAALDWWTWRSWENGLLGEFVASYDTGWGELDFRAAADISGRHDGYLAGLAYGYPLAAGRWEVEPGVGVEWRSAEINRYYFGVSAADALPTRPLYRPDAGVSFEFGVAATYSFAERHSLQLTAGIESFGSEVADSPIVERSSRGKIGIGYLYRF